MADEWDKFTKRLAENVEQAVLTRVRRTLDEYFRSGVKVVYSEEEAAAFLTIGIDTLQAWRKRGLIEFACYPIGKLRDEEDDGDRLGSTYTYDIAGLLSFRERYVRRSITPNAFKLKPELTLLGPEIDERQLRRVA